MSNGDIKDLWQPGPKLDGRVSPPQAKPTRAGGRDPRVLAAAIVLAAAAIAFSLWLAAVWLRASDAPEDGPTLDDVAAGISNA